MSLNINTQSKRVQEKCGFKPYRNVMINTQMGTQEPGLLNLLLNPDKHLMLVFSDPETLLFEDDK